MDGTAYHKSLTGLFLLLLFWLPLPFGSNTVWAQSIMQVSVFAVAGLWLAGFSLGRCRVPNVFVKAWPVHLALLSVLAWIGLQQLSWPVSTLETWVPETFHYYQSAYQALAEPLPSSLPFSLDPHATAAAFQHTLALYLLFALTLLLITDNRQLRWLALCFVIAGTAQALYGALSTLSGWEMGFFAKKVTGRGVATGTFVNRNHLAGFLEMTAAMGVGLLVAQLTDQRSSSFKEWLRATLTTLMSSKVILRASLIVMVVALVLTRSRMGNGAFFSSLMLTGVVYVVLKRKLTRGMAVFFVSLLLIDTLIISNWFGLDQVVNRISSTIVVEQSESTGSASVSIADVRTDVNPVTRELIAQAPLTGTGAGTFYTALPSQRDGGWRGFFDHAHNDYLQFPQELGIPATLALGFAVLFSLWQAIQAIRLRKSRFNNGVAFGALMGGIALMIHSWADFNLQIPANAAYFVVLMAVAFLARFLNLNHHLNHRGHKGHREKAIYEKQSSY